MVKRYVPIMVADNVTPEQRAARPPSYAEDELPLAVAHVLDIRKTAPVGYTVQLAELDDGGDPSKPPAQTVLTVNDASDMVTTKP